MAGSTFKKNNRKNYLVVNINQSNKDNSAGLDPKKQKPQSVMAFKDQSIGPK